VTWRSARNDNIGCDEWRAIAAVFADLVRNRRVLPEVANSEFGRD